MCLNIGVQDSTADTAHILQTLMPPQSMVRSALSLTRLEANQDRDRDRDNTQVGFEKIVTLQKKMIQSWSGQTNAAPVQFPE